MTFYTKDRSQHDRAWARKFPKEFDVIVDEVKKYSPNARKPAAKAEKYVEYLNVITFVLVRTGG